jgi:hypothetical protein
VDIPNPPPTSTVHSNPDDGTSEDPDNVVLGNTNQSEGVKEISTNNVDSRESYDRETTIVDVYFATLTANNLQKDLDPKSMAECKKRSDWNKWKEAIEADWPRSLKERYFDQ